MAHGRSRVPGRNRSRAIHHAGSARDRAFLGLDCIGLQPYLVESLLFAHGGLIGSGHVGTLYLKNPATLPRDMQQKLADLFAEKPARPATDLRFRARRSEEVTAGKLVSEFHTAFSVLELRVPPLRDRLADLPRFAAQFLPGVAIDSAVLDVLALQAWTGNLRELADAPARPRRQPATDR